MYTLKNTICGQVGREEYLLTEIDSSCMQITDCVLTRRNQVESSSVLMFPSVVINRGSVVHFSSLRIYVTV